jgi:hypothetical protein
LRRKKEIGASIESEDTVLVHDVFTKNQIRFYWIRHHKNGYKMIASQN